MKTYGEIDCPDCGQRITRTSPNTKRCKPCALAAHGETKRGFAERTCVVCGNNYKPKGSVQKACDGCKEEYRRIKQAKYRRDKRDAVGAPRKGDMLPCEDCGTPFEYVAGPQRKCKACQYDAHIAGIRKWSAKNPDRIKQYRQKAKDNYSFDGNRIKALKRDNHTCQRCGSKDDLHVHHIDGLGVTTPREQRNNALENLQTLCRSCHTTVHRDERHSNCAP